MNSLGELLAPDDVRLDVEASSKQQLLSRSPRSWRRDKACPSR